MSNAISAVEKAARIRQIAVSQSNQLVTTSHQSAPAVSARTTMAYTQDLVLGVSLRRLRTNERYVPFFHA